MLELLLAGYGVAFAAPFLYRRLGERAGLILALLPLALFSWFIAHYPQVAAGEAVRQGLVWVPSMGVSFSFLLDGLALTFALIITLVGAAVFLFAGEYMHGSADTGRLYGWLAAFMTSMLGVVLADNLLLLFIFWELTSVTSWMLIGFKHESAESRRSALQALLVTGGGGLALLAGFILLGNVSGSYELSALKGAGALVIAHPHYPAIVLLLLLGAFTKSAQFPFHFWLPNAMAAPTPVSAYLHSATMVKAGVYLLARLNFELGGTPLWQNSMLLAGTATMLFSALLSFRQTDLKKLLAYSTLSVLGTLVMLLGIGSKLAVKAFFLYLVAHSLYKATLFLVAGTIDHATGSRDVRQLGGLGRSMPFTAVSAALASASMMGVLPLVGFIGKETLYEALLELPGWRAALIGIAVLANALLVVVSLLVGFKPFWGRAGAAGLQGHDPSWRMLAGPALLALIGLFGGLFPNLLFPALLAQSASAIIAEALQVQLKLWHGFNLVLLLSGATLVAGAGLSLFRAGMPLRLMELRAPSLLLPSAWYEAALSGMLRLAAKQTGFFQNGYLRNYIIVIVLATVVLASAALVAAAGALPPLPPLRFTSYEAVLAIIITAATAMLLRASSRLSAIVAIGVLGFAIGIIFIIYGAPDVAMTTFAIETLNVILFVLVLSRLPRFASLSVRANRLRDAVIAASVGVFMTMTVLYATSFDLQSDLKRYFAESSLPLGKGSNVVNVILVDFRALDTLGEITVLAVAAIGVFALLNLKAERSE